MEANVLQDSSVHQDPTKCKTVPQENTVLRMVWLNLLPIVILVTIVPQVQHNLNKLIVLSAIIVQQEVTSRSHVLMELTDQWYVYKSLVIVHHVMEDFIVTVQD
jgi:hypothetical protein